MDDRAERSYKIRRRVVSLISLMVLLGLFAVVAVYVGKPLLEMAGDPAAFREWVEARGFMGRLALTGIMTLQVVVAMIPGEVIEIAAGYCYGPLGGMLLCLIGAAAGTCIIYGFTKLFGIRMVEAFVSREKIASLRFLQDSRKLNLLIFIIFFIPGTPKDLITYFVGLTPMKLTTFLLISSVARIPSVISSTIGGDALGMRNYTFAVLVFAVTAAVSLAGILIYRRISSRCGEK